ncbi:MAG: MATE family efflux transporter [Lachnospiraceae bacterium]|nr:MATE family efflux transporter [Lachnospiraceae bacterium]
MTKGIPIKVILYFAIPLYIGQLFQLCYSLIDTRIIGSALGENSLAAVGATTSLSDLLIEFLNGMICGFGIIISTFWGAKDKKQVKKAIGGTLFLGIACTAFISIVCLILLPEILHILNVQEELLSDASHYLSIIIAGLMASTLYNICAAVLRAIGDSFTPLLFLIISNVLNILLDYIGVYHLNMGVCGAAAATVISQLCSTILCFFYMRKKYPWIVLNKHEIKPEKNIYRQLIPTGLSMGFMLSFVMLGSLALQTGINALGANIIVAHTGARKITMIFLIPFFVLGTALATYCGQNLGAKQYDRIKKGILDSILVSLGWCVIVLLIVFTLSPKMIQLVTASSEPEILGNATLYLKVNAIFYFLPATICILRNSMQGFGDSKTPLVSSVIEFAGKVLIAYLLVPYIRYLGVIVSEPIVWAIMVIPLLIGMKNYNYDARVKSR